MSLTTADYRPERFLQGDSGEEGGVSASKKLLRAGRAQGRPKGTTPPPFGAGRSSSWLGKSTWRNQEMSYILARLVWEFDLRPERGSGLGEGTGSATEGRACRDEFQIYCCFVSRQSGPVCQFRRRADLPRGGGARAAKAA